MHKRRRRRRNGDERHLWAVPLVLLLGVTFALGIFASRYLDTMGPLWSKLITPEVAIASNSHAGPAPNDPALVRATASPATARVAAPAQMPLEKRADLYSVMDTMRGAAEVAPTQTPATAAEGVPMPEATARTAQSVQGTQPSDNVWGRSLGGELAGQALLAGMVFAASTGISETVADIPKQSPLLHAAEEAVASISGFGLHAGKVREAVAEHDVATVVAAETMETPAVTQEPRIAPQNEGTVATAAPTEAPVEQAITQAPTQVPATQAPTAAPVQTPTQAPTEAPPSQVTAAPTRITSPQSMSVNALLAQADQQAQERANATQDTSEPEPATQAPATDAPTQQPTLEPAAQPTAPIETGLEPTQEPTAKPTATALPTPTEAPTPLPTQTAVPTPEPLVEQTAPASTAPSQSAGISALLTQANEVRDRFNAQPIEEIATDVEPGTAAPSAVPTTDPAVPKASPTETVETPTATVEPASDAELDTEETEDTPPQPLTRAELPPYPRDGDTIGTLHIEGIDLTGPVYQGDSTEVLHEGIGHAFASSIPGEGENVVLYAYSDTFFQDLGQLVPGNTVTFETEYGTYVYEVTETVIFEPGDDSYLRPRGRDLLTMYTEYPFDNPDNALHRYAVIGKLIKGVPVSWEE